MNQAAASLLEQVKNQNTNGAKLEQMVLNLASLKSIKSFCDEYKQKQWPLHLLVLNAGVMVPPLQHTEDGFELQMGTNV